MNEVTSFTLAGFLYGDLLYGRLRYGDTKLIDTPPVSGVTMHSPSLDNTVWYGDQIYLAFASRRYSVLTFNTEVTACVGKTQTLTDPTERFITGLQQAWRLEWSLRARFCAV